MAKLNPSLYVGQQILLVVACEGCGPAEMALVADQLSEAIGEAALNDLSVHLVADVQLADLLAADDLHEDGAVSAPPAALLQVVDDPLTVLILGQCITVHQL